MRPDAWVMAKGGHAAAMAAYGVTPQAQNTDGCMGAWPGVGTVNNSITDFSPNGPDVQAGTRSGERLISIAFRKQKRWPVAEIAIWQMFSRVGDQQ
jgi:hypothetical protein